jgi:hypothetical protein
MRNKRIIASLGLCLLGVVFSEGVGFVALALTGAGHGTGLYAALIRAPEPWGHFIWPIIGLLLPWTEKWPVLGMIFLLLAVNFFAMGSAVAEDGLYYAVRTLKLVPGFTIFVLASYSLVQLSLATFLVLRAFGNRKASSSQNVSAKTE